MASSWFVEKEALCPLESSWNSRQRRGYIPSSATLQGVSVTLANAMLSAIISARVSVFPGNLSNLTSQVP